MLTQERMLKSTDVGRFSAMLTQECTLRSTDVGRFSANAYSGAHAKEHGYRKVLRECLLRSAR